jgi:hypothetical protein
MTLAIQLFPPPTWALNFGKNDEWNDNFSRLISKPTHYYHSGSPKSAKPIADIQIEQLQFLRSEELYKILQFRALRFLHGDGKWVRPIHPIRAIHVMKNLMGSKCGIRTMYLNVMKPKTWRLEMNVLGNIEFLIWCGYLWKSLESGILSLWATTHLLEFELWAFGTTTFQREPQET